MLFIIQHQTSELWMKLMIHELEAAIRFVRADQLDACFKILARVKLIQKQLFEQWAVLETLTPSEYEAFRPALGSSSGFQSAQYRAIEFLLGNKDRARGSTYSATIAATHAGADRACSRRRRSTTNSCVTCRGADCRCRRPASSATGRSRTSATPALVEVFKTIYDDPQQYWDAYEMAEKLVDVEEGFQLWRFRHMKTVERIIGHKPGTGGSSAASRSCGACSSIRFFPS